MATEQLVCTSCRVPLFKQWWSGSKGGYECRSCGTLTSGVLESQDEAAKRSTAERLTAEKWGPEDRSQLSGAANHELDQNLLPGEGVKVIIRGVGGSAMIGTDRRVFVFKKGFMAGSMFGSKVSSFDYRNLTGVHLESGWATGVLALQGPGIGSADLSYWGGKGKHLRVKGRSAVDHRTP